MSASAYGAGIVYSWPAVSQLRDANSEYAPPPPPSPTCPAIPMPDPRQTQYHMLTMRNTSYDTNQRFIERFDLELVTLKANLPTWYREHLDMLVSPLGLE